MTLQDSAPSPPAQSPPRPTPAVPAITLPRPNPGPVAWSDPVPAGSAGLSLGLTLVLTLAGLALLAGAVAVRRHRRRRDGGHDPLAELSAGAEAESPGLRLHRAAQAIRAELVAAFGPTWKARTTEEVARDPALPARFGPDLAGSVVVFLQRVDRVRFAGEECTDLDEMVLLVPPLVAQLREPVTAGGNPAITPAPTGRSGGRRRRRSRLRRSGA